MTSQYRKQAPVERDPADDYLFPLEKILETRLIDYCLSNQISIPGEEIFLDDDDEEYTSERIKAEINYPEPLKFDSETQEIRDLVWKRLNDEFRSKVPVDAEVVVDYRISVTDYCDGITSRAVLGTALIPKDKKPL